MTWQAISGEPKVEATQVRVEHAEVGAPVTGAAVDSPPLTVSIPVP